MATSDPGTRRLAKAIWLGKRLPSGWTPSGATQAAMDYAEATGDLEAIQRTADLFVIEAERAVAAASETIRKAALEARRQESPMITLTKAEQLEATVADVRKRHPHLTAAQARYAAQSALNTGEPAEFESIAKAAPRTSAGQEITRLAEAAVEAGEAPNVHHGVLLVSKRRPDLYLRHTAEQRARTNA